MKLISFVIPCYNSESYMEKAINSLLVKKEEIEIIIVNDGSKDNTLKIANKYKKKYPEVIKVIDKENGGHGSGVNAGLKIAQGKYFKVVDSDDWVNKDALKKTLDTLEKIDVSMCIVNYVYEKDGKSREMNYKKFLPQNKIFGWDEVKKFSISKYLLMHSVIYKTSLLKNINLSLPEHTFYVDNIFVYYPLKFVDTMYYLDVPFYRYFIGRDDQSVNEKVMISRIDQQLKVNKLMLDYFNPLEVKNKNLREYLIHYLDIMVAVSTILLRMDGSKEASEKRQELWNYLDKNKELVKKFKIAKMSNLPSFISIPIYKVVRKIFKFN